MEVKRYHRETVSLTTAEVEKILREHLAKNGHADFAVGGRMEPQIGWNPASCPIDRLLGVEFSIGDNVKWP
jgi:hypothetical protein